MKYPDSFKKLTETISKFPGVGNKSALRLSLNILDNQAFGKELSSSIETALEFTTKCKYCHSLTERKKESICSICSSHSRDKTKVCVVQGHADLIAVEEAGFFDGMFHIVGGVISPLEGVYEENLNLDSLFSRIKKNKVEEIVYAIPPSLESDATYLVIRRRIEDRGCKVKFSKLAVGLPMGSNIDYVDSGTILKAFENRVFD